MKTPKILIIAVFFVILQVKAHSVENLLFKPLTANTFEPRTGCFYQFSEVKLRLDIGASFDILSLSKTEDSEYRLGADFFTYTRLRSQKNFKFPVETSDYFFGINHSAKTRLFGEDFYYRIRLAHISSHLVDGYSSDSIFWKQPFVYSREFVTASGAFYIFEGFRAYLTLKYVFSMQHDDAEPLIPSIGFDFSKKLSEIISFDGGYEFKIVGFDSEYFGINTAQMGITAKVSEFAGIFLGIYAFSGKSMHGMFYNQRDEYFGFGFQIIFY